VPKISAHSTGEGRALSNMDCADAKINRWSLHDSTMMTPFEETTVERECLRIASWVVLQFLQCRLHGFTTKPEFRVRTRHYGDTLKAAYTTIAFNPLGCNARPQTKALANFTSYMRRCQKER